jgi:hypothetical protein
MTAHSVSQQEKVDSFIEWKNLRHQECYQQPADCEDADGHQVGVLKRVKDVRDDQREGLRGSSVAINMIGFPSRALGFAWIWQETVTKVIKLEPVS